MLPTYDRHGVHAKIAATARHTLPQQFLSMYKHHSRDMRMFRSSLDKSMHHTISETDTAPKSAHFRQKNVHDRAVGHLCQRQETQEFHAWMRHSCMQLSGKKIYRPHAFFCKQHSHRLD
jgi:hypothetical protein